MFAVVGLVGLTLKIWLDPAYSSSVDGNSLTGSPKSLKQFSAKRTTYSGKVVGKINEKNLFRKERVEFKKAVSIIPESKAPKLPPPNIRVKGILLLNKMQIAVLEGNYSYLSDKETIKEKAVKRKGYFVGDAIGDYRITTIEREAVHLKNDHGELLTVALNKRKSVTPISRTEKGLFHSDKKRRRPVVQAEAAPPGQTPFTNASPPSRKTTANKPPAPGPGAMAGPPGGAPPAYISGSRQPTSNPRGQSISGFRTGPARPHFSGR